MCTRPARSKKILESRETTEVPHEDLDGIREIETSRPTWTSGALKPLLTIAVIHRTFFRITKDFISLGDLLEKFLGFFRAFVPIRMILERKLPVPLLDLLEVRIT